LAGLLGLEIHHLVAHYLGLDGRLLIELLAGEAQVGHIVNFRCGILLDRGLWLMMLGGLLLLANVEGIILTVHGTTTHGLDLHRLDLHRLLHQELDGGLGYLVDLVGHGFHLVGA
jgi:hypothetical protein